MQEHKTIREWYEMLPPPYREQAIENATQKGHIELEEKSLYDALLAGFGWSKAESLGQGLDYWSKVAYCAYIGNFDGLHAKLNTLPLIHSTQYNKTIYAHKSDA